MIPAVLRGDSIDLEGRKLQVFGLDGPAPERTVVWIPSLNAVCGGVALFSGLHVWMTDTQAPPARERWLSLLDRIEQLAPSVVIPGHYQGASKFDLSAVRFTREYIQTFDAETPKAKSSVELMAVMKQHYPKAGLEISLQISSKVAKGELAWE